MAQRQPSKKAFLAFREKLHADFRAAAPQANFEYTLTVNKVTIDVFDINTTDISNIKISDKIFADRGEPFFIEIRARLDDPTGTGSLQLKDLVAQKNVFDEPQEFTFDASGKGGLFLKNVKLP